MTPVERLKAVYGRVLRHSPFGWLVAIPVRLVKRIAVDPAPALREKVDQAAAAGAGLQSDVLRLSRALARQNEDIERLHAMVSRLSEKIDSLQAHGPDAAPADHSAPANGAGPHIVRAAPLVVHSNEHPDAAADDRRAAAVSQRTSAR